MEPHTCRHDHLISRLSPMATKAKCEILPKVTFKTHLNVGSVPRIEFVRANQIQPQTKHIANDDMTTDRERRNDPDPDRYAFIRRKNIISRESQADVFKRRVQPPQMSIVLHMIRMITTCQRLINQTMRGDSKSQLVHGKSSDGNLHILLKKAQTPIELRAPAQISHRSRNDVPGTAISQKSGVIQTGTIDGMTANRQVTRDVIATEMSDARGIDERRFPGIDRGATSSTG